MIHIDFELQPTDLTTALDRMWQLSGEKIRSIQQSLTADSPAPIFTIEGQYVAQGWTEWTQGFQCSAIRFARCGLCHWPISWGML